MRHALDHPQGAAVEETVSRKTEKKRRRRIPRTVTYTRAEQTARRRTVVEERSTAVVLGNVLIHEDGKTIRVTVSLKGNKGSGMIDIYAHKLDKKWKHDSIDVRLKKPEKHTIKLLR